MSGGATRIASAATPGSKVRNLLHLAASPTAAGVAATLSKSLLCPGMMVLLMTYSGTTSLPCVGHPANVSIRTDALNFRCSKLVFQDVNGTRTMRRRLWC